MERDFDVTVVGGGPAGIGAALGAARQGARVALIERHAVLGGMGTAALVNNFCPAHWDGRRFIIGGVFQELRGRLIAKRALHQTGGLEPYDPAVFAAQARELLEDAGAELFLETKFTRVSFERGHAARIDLDSGALLRSRTVVDASGDASVAHAAGVPFTFGDGGHGVMPLTFCYAAGPVDLERFRAAYPHMIHFDRACGEERVSFQGWSEQAMEWIRIARADGTLSIQRDHISSVVSVPGDPTTVTVNYGRVFVKDPTDPDQLAEAEREGRRQIAEGIAFMRRFVQGFERYELKEVARQIGVRETRQIQGLYRLTVEDVLGCRQFEDAIAQCNYPVDVHHPHDDGTTMTALPKGGHYDIPWRCLVPSAGPENLLVAGRCISATQEAMSSFRVSPSVMAIGEAAGTGAALAAEGNGSVRSIEVGKLQDRLRRAGAILE
ncbi:MAG: FAD-dependent oxidoreductase [Planctomycetes bacterium]|nr:FAD-dependent oxidoreductase [Planctomycetota bacterium]